MFDSLHSLRKLKNFIPSNFKEALVQTMLIPIFDYADVSRNTCMRYTPYHTCNFLQDIVNVFYKILY